ncbi:hypothetical protein AJ90_24205 [Vibrio parahaemolyticus M0605]|nr:hypothetical protein AJ90_24205 [Vibrio parahaemolyticus M0605]
MNVLENTLRNALGLQQDATKTNTNPSTALKHGEIYAY